MVPVQKAADVAQQLHKACQEVGFFYVSCAFPTSPAFGRPYCLVKRLNVSCETIQVANHGVPGKTCHNVLKEAHAWFALPVPSLMLSCVKSMHLCKLLLMLSHMHLF